MLKTGYQDTFEDQINEYTFEADENHIKGITQMQSKGSRSLRKLMIISYWNSSKSNQKHTSQRFICEHMLYNLT